MKARTLIALAVMVVLAMMVLPALAQSRLLTASTASSAAAINLPAPANLPNAAPKSGEAKPIDPNGIDRLINATGGAINVSVSRATGAVRFITVLPDRPGALSALVGANKTPQQQAETFFAAYGSLFGITDASTQLKWVDSQTDSLGTTRVQYRQMYKGVPVFAGIMLVHFNAKNQLTAINGVFVPEIAVDATPKLTSAEANAIAVNAVGPTGISARKTTLYVYRTGLAQGVVGSSYLVYEVEATNGVNVRDFVYVEARTGKIVDRVSALDNALTRRVYSGTYTTTALIWQEGAPFPFTGVFSADINSIISTTGETYNLFASSFGRDSYDALGHVMETVNNDPRINCPNANWNGITTNYCTGVTGDDTVAHEWGHAYTEYTHNLIYAWQPGALNESYSDIWGEVVDLLNGRGKDTPGGLRTDGLCSVFSSPAPVLQINSPAAIAGNYPAAASSFGPSLITPTNWVTNVIVLVNDGVGRDGSVTPPVDGNDATTSDGCTPYVNAAAVAGKIALIDRGTCTFQIKADNANAAGAIGFIVVNHQSGGNGLINMAGTGGTAVGIFTGYSTGLTIRSQLANTVNATLKSTGGVADNSYRWLSGEDDPAFGEAIRDLWNPNCYTDPARVSDAYYQCDASDGGGVHTNSGVPNHAFALLVDGGHFNGYTITGISMTKAVHLYWRAQSVYQVPTTDFSDHADALLASCNDLVAAGTNLPLPTVFATTTVASGQVFTTTDCLQVQKVISATEMRVDPTAQCNFQPLLNLNAPALCAPYTGPEMPVFKDTFEVASGWTLTHTDVYSASNVNWVRRTSLPDGRAGYAFYALDGDGQCTEGPGDASRVLYLASPVITLPVTATVPRLAFDHYIATEGGYDGGNLKISVNGGPWQLVARSDFTFNSYNTTFAAAPGNTNPLAGQAAFSGADGGKVTGSWGRSIVKINNYAHPGDTVRLRFEFGNDGCGRIDGWYVDDVEAYFCAAESVPGVRVQAPTVVAPGGVLQYSIVISNPPFVGTRWLTDVLPGGVTFAGGLSASSGTPSYISGTNSVLWTDQITFRPQGPSISQGIRRPASAKLDAIPASVAARSAVPTIPDAPVSLVLDDGSLENDIGLNGGGKAFQYLWFNRFTPTQTFPIKLNQIQVMFDAGVGVSVGSAMDLAVYEDNDGDPSNGASLLATFPVTVQYTSGITWSVYNLPTPVIVQGGHDVLIGVINRYVTSGVTPSGYPSAIDQTITTTHRSWVAAWLGDPPALPYLPTDDPTGMFVIDDVAPSLAGNWMIRGYGDTVTVPTNNPVTLSFNVTATTSSNTLVTNTVNLNFVGSLLQGSHTFKTGVRVYLPLIRK